MNREERAARTEARGLAEIDQTYPQHKGKVPCSRSTFSLSAFMQQIAMGGGKLVNSLPLRKISLSKIPLLLSPCAKEGTIISRCPADDENRHVRRCSIHGTCTRLPAGKQVAMTCDRCAIEGKGYETTIFQETIVGSGPVCIVTLNIGNVMGPNARASMMAAANRWGVVYAEIQQPIQFVGGKFHWQKTFLAQWALKRGYSRVAYYDSDIVIRSDCPSPFDAVPIGSLGVVSNQQKDFPELSNRHHLRYTSDRKWWAARLKIKAVPAEHHVNGGLIVFEPSVHAELFTQWHKAGELVNYGRADVLVDEIALSTLLENNDIPRVWMPPTFNLLFYRAPQLNSSPVMVTHAYHGAGKEPKFKLNSLRWDLTDQALFTWRAVAEEGMFDFQAVYTNQVQRVETGVFVELGSWKGKSSMFMAEAIKRSGKQIRFYCIDTWKGSESHKWMKEAVKRAGGDMLDVWRDNLKRGELIDYATPIQEDSARAARHFAEGSVDFIFVDADHRFDNVVEDIRAWRSKLSLTGVMGGHDFDMEDVARAVRQEFGEDGFTVVGRSWVAIRK